MEAAPTPGSKVRKRNSRPNPVPLRFWLGFGFGGVLGFWIFVCSSSNVCGVVRFLCLFAAESMWRMGLGGGGGGGGEAVAAGRLPERPGEADCVYYLRTGACGYGENCRYNHPRDRAAAAVVSTNSPSRCSTPLFFFSPPDFSYGDNDRPIGLCPVDFEVGGFKLKPLAEN